MAAAESGAGGAGQSPAASGRAWHEGWSVGQGGWWARHGALGVVVGLLVGVYLGWPGAVPFVWDEPHLVLNAFMANAAGRPAVEGLPGSFGLRYGPVPTWVYQACLLVSHDAVAVSAMHAALGVGLLAAGLLWMGRVTGWWRWGAIAAAGSPYVWYYTRLLWDNTLNLPLGVLMLAAYGQFLRRGNRWLLLPVTVLGGMMLLTHFMSAALCAAVGGHLVWTLYRDGAGWLGRRGVRGPGGGEARGATARRSLGVVVLGVLIVGIVGSQYWTAVGWSVAERVGVGPAGVSQRGRTAGFGGSGIGVNWRAVVYPVMGHRLFTGWWLDYFFFSFDERPGHDAYRVHRARYLWDAGGWSVALGVASAVTGAAFAFGAAGAARAARSLGLGGESAGERQTVGGQLLWVSVGAVLLHVVVNGVASPPTQPHYNNGIFGALLVVLWAGLDWAGRGSGWRGVLGRVLAAVYLACLCGTTLLLMGRVVATRGLVGPEIGPVLGEQLRAVRAVRGEGAGRRDVEVRLPGFVEPYDVLFVLEAGRGTVGGGGGNAESGRGRWVIEPAEPWESSSAVLSWRRESESAR